MAHKLKEQTDYYKEKTEARQSICYIIINKMSLTLSDKSIPRYRPDENKYHITNPSSYQ